MLKKNFKFLGYIMKFIILIDDKFNYLISNLIKLKNFI